MIVDLRKSAATWHHTRGGTLSGIKPEILRELDFLIVVCCMAGDARTEGFQDFQVQVLKMRFNIFFPQEMRELRVSPETSAESCTFFVWPLDIVHVIGSNYDDNYNIRY